MASPGVTLTAVGSGVPESRAAAPDPDRAGRLADSIKAQRTITQIERNLGGRDVILAELLRAPNLDPQIRALLDLLYDPRFDQLPLPILCERVGITPGDLFAAFRDATIATAHIHAVRMVAARLPQVITNLVDQAVDHQAPCPSCEGTKVEGQICPRCKDRGTITVMANADQQKVVLEMMGLLKKGVGFQLTDNSTTTITQQQTNLGGGAGGSLFDLQKAVGAVLHRQALRLPTTETAAVPAVESSVPAEAPVVEAQLVERGV